MKQEDILKKIVAEARIISLIVPHARWYGFGSFFKSHIFSDIDILIVCYSSSEAISIRKLTKNICSDWPLHLLVMTEKEEVETEFIDSQGCSPLWQSQGTGLKN